jgi:predicted transcriptional regulator
MFGSRKNQGALGPLESQLLRLLWNRGSGTVRDILQTGEFTVAYTTVMTTLDRLHKKGLLDRVAEGRAYRYSPSQTQHEFNGAAVRRAIRELLGSADSSHMPLSFLVDAVSEHDRALLDELQRVIEEKRRELDEQEER